MKMRVRFALLFALLTAALPLFAQTDSEEEYDVTIVFIGLMSLDLGETPSPGDPVTVIIPDYSNAAKIGKNKDQDVPKHVAYLLADRDALSDQEPLNQNYVFAETAHPTDPFHYLPFRGMHVSIDEENDVAALNKPLSYDNAGCGECPDDDPDGNVNTNDGTNGKLCWLSSMKKVKGGAQKREEAHFARRAPKLTPKTVAGRMLLRYGTLSAYVVNPAPKWDFKLEDGTTWTRALAQETHWKFRARGVPFVLNLQGIERGSQRVAFRPQHGELVIVIGHTTDDDAGPYVTPASPVPDAHYAAYYRFVDGNAGDGPIPAPQAAANNCKKFTRKPILQTLLARAPQTAPSGTEHGHGGGRPAPGGLNCSSNQWP